MTAMVFLSSMYEVDRDTTDTVPALIF